MSIKRVTCPGCKQTLNVPASMASTKCPHCGTVFSPANPAAAQSAPSRPSNAPASPPRDSGQLMQYLIFGTVAMLAVLGVLLLTFFRSAPENENGPAAAPTAPPPAMAAQEDATAPSTSGDFREVDLPESTRKKIYNDYRRMIASSFGKSKRIPKGGAAGQALEGMLQGTVDREIKQMALIYHVSEDDILQIVAEGDAKGWSNAAR